MLPVRTCFCVLNHGKENKRINLTYAIMERYLAYEYQRKIFEKMASRTETAKHVDYLLF
jgi:hypothetical protein